MNVRFVLFILSVFSFHLMYSYAQLTENIEICKKTHQNVMGQTGECLQKRLKTLQKSVQLAHISATNKKPQAAQKQAFFRVSTDALTPNAYASNKSDGESCCIMYTIHSRMYLLAHGVMCYANVAKSFAFSFALFLHKLQWKEVLWRLRSKCFAWK